VLGVELINGRGERMRFGGRVMKNVAGFDVSRLQAGAFGAFGVLTEITLKVVPRPANTLTLAETLDAGEAIRRMSALAGLAKPLTAAAWADGRLYLRLSGSESAVAGTAAQWGLETVPNGDEFWRDLAEQQAPFFDDPRPLWRFSVRPSAPLAPLAGAWLIDWGGAQRFIHGDFDKAQMESLAEAAGGHATLYRGGDRRGEVHHTLPQAMRALHVRLKDAFDPDRILNPGRLYGFV
jgi:glycolate dehydrogenase FAD-binding subunit